MPARPPEARTNTARPAYEPAPPLSLDALLHERQRCLADILAAISHEITVRKDISAAITTQIEETYSALKSEILTLQRTPLRFDRTLDQKRATIDACLAKLRAESRNEQSQCWRDITRLTEELRTWTKQYEDLAQRVRLLTTTTRRAPGESPPGEYQ